MTRVDWVAVDEVTRHRLNPDDIAYAALDGVEAGLRRFRLQLWLGRLLALLVVVAVTGGGFAARAVVHDDPLLPPATGPAVTALTPAAGPEEGGTLVVVTGPGLASATAVAFGATTVTDLDVDDEGRISVTAPQGQGTVDVIVTTPEGSTEPGPGARFDYLPPNRAPPTLRGIDPRSGPEDGGTTVVISGAELAGATEVFFGPSSAEFQADSNERITATAPAGTGVVGVRVTTEVGTSPAVRAAQFTYEPPADPPVVTAVTPPEGPVAGGTPVRISGTGLTDATAVVFGDVAAGSFEVVDDQTISVTSPAGVEPGTVAVTVTTAAGTSTPVEGNEFTYLPPPEPPVVETIDPDEGPERGGETVVIVGSGFTGATAVMFGDTAAAGFTIVDDGRISAVTPEGPGGTRVAVLVTTPAGTSPRSAGYFYRADDVIQ